MTSKLLTAACLIFALASTPPGPILSQADPGWIGKRIVQKNSDFTLIDNGEAVETSGKPFGFYRVEQADGPSFLLKSETRGQSGWATADEVVLVEHALDFFTQQIRAHPDQAFFHAARALIWRDAKAFDNALRDYDEAVRLDSKNAAYYWARGLVRHSAQDDDRAITDFDLAIRLDPKFALAFIGRGASRAAKKEYSKAIADFSEAIWLDPLAITAYASRGQVWYAKKEFAKAIIDDNMVIRLDPQHTVAYCNRAGAWGALRRFDKAIADFNQALQIDAKCARAHGGRAWIWATCPNAQYRDGKNAVESATRACELTAWKEPRMLDVLAAAHAEAGDFDSAVNWQTKSNALRPDGEEKRRGQLRLERYQEKKPVREPNG